MPSRILVGVRPFTTLSRTERGQVADSTRIIAGSFRADGAWPRVTPLEFSRDELDKSSEGSRRRKHRGPPLVREVPDCVSARLAPVWWRYPVGASQAGRAARTSSGSSVRPAPCPARGKPSVAQSAVETPAGQGGLREDPTVGRALAGSEVSQSPKQVGSADPPVGGRRTAAMRTRMRAAGGRAYLVASTAGGEAFSGDRITASILDRSHRCLSNTVLPPRCHQIGPAELAGV